MGEAERGASLEKIQDVLAQLDEARVEEKRARSMAAMEAERRVAAIAERQAHENVMGWGACTAVRRVRRAPTSARAQVHLPRAA